MLKKTRFKLKMEYIEKWYFLLEDKLRLLKEFPDAKTSNTVESIAMELDDIINECKKASKLI